MLWMIWAPHLPSKWHCLLGHAGQATSSNITTLSSWHECHLHVMLFRLASSAVFGWCEWNTFIPPAAREQNLPLRCDTTCRVLFVFASDEPQQCWLIYELWCCRCFMWTRLNGKRRHTERKHIFFIILVFGLWCIRLFLHLPAVCVLDI